MASTYRKRKGIQYDTWHFCSNCSKWPTSDYDERSEKPTNGEFVRRVHRQTKEQQL